MRGKDSVKRRRRLKDAKVFLMFMATALILCSIIGATVAWLITDTDPVVNTFTYGDINITLEETNTNMDDDDNVNTNEYLMVPGNRITKDPEVTFKANSENAWLFVKLEKSANFDDFMTYEIAEGWIPLDGVAGVYYREVSKAETDAVYEVIKDNAVNVKGEVTKEMLNALDAGEAKNYPTLTVTAYAVQRDSNITTAADAWAQIPAGTNN